MTSSAKVIFIPVKDSATKIHTLVSVATHFFTQGSRLLFSVASDEVARYIDELLWKLPAESFLPHAIVSRPSNEFIAITTGLENYNQASILFNLRPEANTLAKSFALTYELLDETHPSKLEQSLQRQKVYQEQGLII